VVGVIKKRWALIGWFWSVLAGLLSLDLPLSSSFRVVHWCLEGCGKEGCQDECAGNPYLHYSVLSQVWFENNDAGKMQLLRTLEINFYATLLETNDFEFPVHLWEPLPAAVKEEHVYRPQGSESFRTAGHDLVPQIRPEEAQSREQDWSFQLWTKATHQRNHVQLWGSEQGTETSLLYSPFWKFRMKMKSSTLGHFTNCIGWFSVCTSCRPRISSLLSRFFICYYFFVCFWYSLSPFMSFRLKCLIILHC